MTNVANNPKTLFEISPRTVGDAIFSSQTHAIGGGEWSEEYFDEAGNFLFEIIGENGTRCNDEELKASLQEMERQKEVKGAKLLPLNERINLRASDRVRYLLSLIK